MKSKRRDTVQKKGKVGYILENLKVIDYNEGKDTRTIQYPVTLRRTKGLKKTLGVDIFFYLCP